MQLQIVDAISDAAGQVNEDLFGTAYDAVWVLDGATGLGGERVLPGLSDARWFVDQVDAYLRSELDVRLTASELLRRVLRQVIRRFEQAAIRHDAAAPDTPGACIAMARLRAGGLELANLGDCRILRRGRGGNISSFGTSKITALDEVVRQEVIRLQGTNLPYDEIWLRLLPLLRHHRGMRNRLEGYWTLDLSERGADHVEEISVAVEAGDNLLLVTDGFSRLVDAYGRHSDDSLFAVALRDGLEALRRELRVIEAADEACRRYPRLKVRDDATAVLARVVTSG